jgi:hypothetical protein
VASSTLRRGTWVDALIAAIDRLPGPAWLPYLLGSLILAAIGTALGWADGSIPPGELSFVRVFNDGSVLYPIAVIHYLMFTARSALDVVTPALGELATEKSRLERAFTVTSWPLVIVGMVLGTAFAAAFAVFDPAAIGLSESASTALVVFVAVVGTFGSIAQAILVLFVLNQMIQIVRVHRMATAITLFDSRTHGAFARLTLRGSIGLALPVYVFTFHELVAGNPTGAITGPEIVLVIALVGGAAGVFFIPLAGIHRRLVRQKADLVATINLRFAELAESVRGATAPTDVGEKKAMMEALLIERDVVRKLSTWPWEAETLRGFLSSIGLPILLWFVTTLLGRLLGS